MRTVDAESAFAAFLAARAGTIDALNATAAVNSMVDFYVGIRAEDVDIDDDGDMLLFQWGTYDWGGPSFEYDITRQLITAAADIDDNDDAFWQLSLTLHFEHTSELNAIGSGERWCKRPSDVMGFKEFVTGCAATLLTSRSSPRRVELSFGPAG